MRRQRDLFPNAKSWITQNDEFNYETGYEINQGEMRENIELYPKCISTSRIWVCSGKN